MTGRARGRSCVALLAALFSLVLAPVRHDSANVYNPVSDRTTFDSTALIAALPRVLSPPVLKPGSRLVSMIAEDIDADGDLDVVANDGSLNLIVWTNDGSGRLSPRQSHEVAGLQSEPARPDRVTPVEPVRFGGSPLVRATRHRQPGRRAHTRGLASSASDQRRCAASGFCLDARSARSSARTPSELIRSRVRFYPAGDGHAAICRLVYPMARENFIARV